ncbi:MAG: ATP synthase F0 subunit B, partial [Firmicutes bacterium]|nr:ATP synthase F0 subunit B [Bacillota bacterium]
ARTMERAQEQIALEKKQAMNDLKDQVSGMALDIASAVLEEDIDGKKHTQLIDRFIKDLGEQA